MKKPSTLNLKMRYGAIHISTVELRVSKTETMSQSLRPFETMVHDGKYNPVVGLEDIYCNRHHDQQEAECWHNHACRVAKSGHSQLESA